MLATGSLFHQHYNVGRCIGVGGMGAVYDVLDNRTQRRRALKVMLPRFLEDGDARARFALEAIVAADVESEHIVQVLDAGIDQETRCPYIVMELLRGLDLAQVLQRLGCQPAPVVVELARKLARALDRTHARGIVHRDLKPENLFLSVLDDDTVQIKVLDFGIAKLAAASGQGARTTLTLGTPSYMSPEQIRGDGNIGYPADLYSLAQVVFTMLVGEAYFDHELKNAGGGYPALMKILVGPQTPACVVAKDLGIKLPMAFDDWFRRATAREASERFPTAAEMVEALAQVFGDALAQAEPRSKVWSILRNALKDEAARSASLPIPKKGNSSRTGTARSRVWAPWTVAASAAAVAAAAWVGRVDTGDAGLTSSPEAKTEAVLQVRDDRPLPKLERMSSAQAEQRRSIGPEPLVLEPVVATRVADPTLSHLARAAVANRPAPVRAAVPNRDTGQASEVERSAETDNCSPPYYLDARGIKRYQPECLSASR